MSAEQNRRFATIGVAGCGSMGRPMAERLLAAGFDVLGFDVRAPEEFDTFAQHLCTDPATFAERVDCVISVVRDARQTHDLCFDEQALFAGERTPATLVLCSTLSPRVVTAVRERLPTAVHLVDAPMSGAPHGARDGTLSFMLGGEHDDLEQLDPLFAAMGRRRFRLGALGAGMTVKVLNNYVTASSVVASRRVLELAGVLNVPRRPLTEVMRESSGANWYVDHLDEIDWAAEGFDERNTIGILEKDVHAALDVEDLVRSPFDQALLEALRALREL